MKRFFLTAILATGCMLTCFAQTEDPLSAKKEKIFDHYIGIQINGLIKQVFNFNNSTTSTNTNPYLVTYHITAIESGWGLRLGLGYNYNSSTATDVGTSRTSDINDLQLRVGVEKSFTLSDKWHAGAGIDFAYNKNDDKTTAITTATDTITTVTHTVTSSSGGGAMAWLRYNITKNILIGTEASFYYLKGKTNTSTAFQENFGGNTQTTNSESENKLSTGTLSMPVVFYLLVKF